MTSVEWAIDYDIFSPEFVQDPFAVWDELRDVCPIAHTERWGGSWMPTSYADIVAIAADVETFSSREILVTPPPVDQGANADAYANVAAPPITSDPPNHHADRRLILPGFAPKAVAKYEDSARALCNRLIDGFIETGRGDIAEGYAQQIPVRIIAAMLGVPQDRADEFTGWVRGVLEFGLTDPAARLVARDSIIRFFMEQIALRRANPTDDLISELLASEIDGKPVPDHQVIGTCNLLLLAGVDTTWSSIGASLWHLAQRPDHRKQLRENPEIWPMAIEELLRAFAPVTMARVVTKDVEVGGCPMKAGDKVLMPFPAANRDPAVFDAPDEVILDRAQNRHVAFGSGIHRCAGSNLARLELRVAVQTWLERIPDYELENPAEVRWAGGQVRGPRHAPVVFEPGTRLAPA